MNSSSINTKMVLLKKVTRQENLLQNSLWFVLCKTGWLRAEAVEAFQMRYASQIPELKKQKKRREKQVIGTSKVGRASCLIDEPNKVGFKVSPQVYRVNN